MDKEDKYLEPEQPSKSVIEPAFGASGPAGWRDSPSRQERKVKRKKNKAKRQARKRGRK